MDFYKVLETRTSIKKFKSDQIKEESIGKMINAAMLSPSWKNNTSYKFIIVDDQRIREKLGETINNDTEDAQNAINDAPLTVVVVGNPSESGQINGKDFYLVDAAIAMEHFILAATNEGYGTCWMASFDENKIKNILGIPKEYKVIALTPIGVTEEAKNHYPMKPVDSHIYLNNWENEYSHKNLVMS